MKKLRKRKETLNKFSLKRVSFAFELKGKIHFTKLGAPKGCKKGKCYSTECVYQIVSFICMHVCLICVILNSSILLLPVQIMWRRP
jgi:hypothetical protein